MADEKKGWGDQTPGSDSPKAAAPPPAAPAAPAAPAPLKLDTSIYETWTKEQAFDWLASKAAAFEKYRASFYENEVTGELLKDAVLSDDDTLKDFGVSALHQSQMKKFVQALVDGKDVPTAPATPGSARGRKGKEKQVAAAAVEETAAEFEERMERLKLEEEQKQVIWEINAADPNSQLIAAKKWEDLDLKDGLLKALYGTMKFQKPSKIQEQALPLGLKNPPENGIYQARSGHGKTCAFSLIMLMRIDEAAAQAQALCLAPVYELAIQTEEVCRLMGQSIGATTQLAVADRSCHFAKGEVCTKHIIIGTPGKVMSLLKMKVINGKAIKCFVLDEADLMVADSGHKETTLKIKKFMPEAQTLLFSASFEDVTYKFAKKLCTKKVAGKAAGFNEIKIKDVKDVMLSEISQFYIKTNAGGNEDANKMEALNAIFGCLTVGQSIIFVERKTTANALEQFLTSKGQQVAALHGNIEKEDRKRLYQEFKDMKRRVLIATNALARGIDVPGMSLVVNYDFPTKHDDPGPDFEMYQHRIGRCGRFGRKGCAFTFIHTAEDQKMLDETVGHFKCEVKEADIEDPEELEELVKNAQKAPSK